MPRYFDSLLKSLSASLQNLTGSETPEQQQSRETLALQQAVATLLYETARANHEVKESDLQISANSLRELFALPEQQVMALLSHAAQPHQRPTSYHPLIKLINKHFSAAQKNQLIEHMWRVAHADLELDMYEDHLVRKIAELLYVPHTEFITAKHRARSHSR
jgi:uncharacterized tellurite resistance protein B-like protein